MTALNAPIKFNSSTGSDSTASGCGPATAVNVTIQTSGGSNTATASWTGTISVGDLMYIPDAAFLGRRYNVIASVGSGSLTFDDNWDDSSFGTSGYVGGKRATFDDADSRQLFSSDIFTMDSVEIETETDQTLSSTHVDLKLQTYNGNKANHQIRGSSGSIKTITQTAADYHFDLKSSPYCYWSNLKFDNSNATTNSSCQVFRCVLQNPTFNFIDCVFGDPTNTIYSTLYDNTGSLVGSFSRCKFQNTTNYASQQQGHNAIKYSDCYFKDCFGGVKQGSSGYGYTGGSFARCVFDGITNEAILNNAVFNQVLGLTDIDSCVFHSCGTGYKNQSHARVPMLVNNIFSSCFIGIDFQGSGGGGHVVPLVRGNAFYNNTVDVGKNAATIFENVDPINLDADPFVDSASSDFNIANNLGGGSVLRSTKYTLGG